MWAGVGIPLVIIIRRSRRWPAARPRRTPDDVGIAVLLDGVQSVGVVLSRLGPLRHGAPSVEHRQLADDGLPLHGRTAPPASKGLGIFMRMQHIFSAVASTKGVALSLIGSEEPAYSHMGLLCL